MNARSWRMASTTATAKSEKLANVDAANARGIAIVDSKRRINQKNLERLWETYQIEVQLVEAAKFTGDPGVSLR